MIQRGKMRGVVGTFPKSEFVVVKQTLKTEFILYFFCNTFLSIIKIFMWFQIEFETSIHFLNGISAEYNLRLNIRL